MIIVLRRDATKEQVEHIIEKVQKLGLTPHVSKGTERTIIGVIGPEDAGNALRGLSRRGKGHAGAGTL